MVPALTRVFSNALAGGVSNVSFSDLSADLGRTMYEFKFRIPPYYTLLVRTLSVLEVGFPNHAAETVLTSLLGSLVIPAHCTSLHILSCAKHRPDCTS